MTLRTILALLLTVSLNAQSPADRRARDAAADRGLQVMTELADVHAQTLGVTTDEALRAHLLPALPLHFVSLERLSRFGSGEDPRAVLGEAETFWYPVVVGDEIRALITVQKRSGVWVASSLGAATLAKRIAILQRELPRADSVVFITGLNAYFLKRDERGEMRLASFDDRFGPPTETHEAATLFRELQNVSQSPTRPLLNPR